MTEIQRSAMDEFAEHEGSGGGNRTEFLKWKDDKKGEVEVILLAAPRWVWRHSWQRVVEYDDDSGKVQKVGMYTWVTMEPPGKDEERLKSIKKQAYWIDSKTPFEDRVKPKVDPFLRMLEWVYGAVLRDEIDWLDEVFKFVAADSEDRVIHAGGLLKMYPSNFDKFEKDEVAIQKRKFKEAGIVQLNNTFKENASIGIKYVFVVVDANAVSEGPKIAIEAEALGNAVKRSYSDRKVRLEKKKQHDRINPIKRTPYQWEFDNSKDFEKKYRVVELEDLEDVSEDLAAVFEEELPDLSRYLEPGNVAVLEENFRTHWCHKVTPPWKEIFAPAYEAVAGTDKAELPSANSRGSSSRKEEDDSEPSKPSGTHERVRGDVGRKLDQDIASGKAKPKSEPPPPPVSTVPCEKCDRPMPDDALVCPHCDARYVQVGAFVCLEQAPCEACGKDRPMAEMTCPHCKAEYREGDEKIELAPKPAPTEPRASRRRQAAAKS